MHAEGLRQARREQRPFSPVQSPTFLDRMFSFLFGSNDPEREKKRLLKEIERRLKSSRHHFYRAKTEQVLPAMGKFFHELYSIVGPAQLLVDHADSSEVLKVMIIEQGFGERQRELLDKLSEEEIGKRVNEIGLAAVDAEAKDMVTELLASFDAHQVKEINDSYNLLTTFLDIVHFDYYFLLKKFDQRLPEQDFRYAAHFDPIPAEQVLDELKDFLSLLYLVDPQADWKSVLAVLKVYRNADVVPSGDWHRVLRLLSEVRRSEIFELCVRHASKDPLFRVKVVFPNEAIVEDYLTRLKTRTELTLQTLLKQQHDQTIEKYTVAVFGTSSVSVTKNYTAKRNALFSQRLVGGFIHAEAINLLQAFLLSYFRTEIQELVDLLIVRGRWSAQLTSQQLSESFHFLQEAAADLTKLDDELAEDAELGIRIDSLIWKADRDRTAARTLRDQIREINERAAGIINRSARNLIVMGKSFKIVLDDYDSKSREQLANWREIESMSGGRIRAKIVDAYKKIYFFIQLIQHYIKKEPPK